MIKSKIFIQYSAIENVIICDFLKISLGTSIYPVAYRLGFFPRAYPEKMVSKLQNSKL